LDLLVVLITAIPLYGGSHIVRRELADLVRLLISFQAVVLTIAAWSVLTEFTLEFSRLELHFGLYLTLVANLVATLYSFLKFQENRRHSVQNLFCHTSEKAVSEAVPGDHVPAPQIDQPEDFRIRH